MVRVGQRERIDQRDIDRLDRPGLDQASDDPVRHAADDRQLADQAEPIADPLERLGALRREPVRDMAGGAIFGDRPRSFERRRGGKGHPKDGAERGEIIIGRPLDEAAKRRRQRRQVEDLEQGPEPVVADLLGLEPLRFPDGADQLARTQRRDDDRSGLDRHAMRNPVVERPERGIEEDDTGTAHRRAITSLRSLPEGRIGRTRSQPMQHRRCSSVFGKSFHRRKKWTCCLTAGA